MIVLCICVFNRSLFIKLLLTTNIYVIFIAKCLSFGIKPLMIREFHLSLILSLFVVLRALDSPPPRLIIRRFLHKANTLGEPSIPYMVICSLRICVDLILR